MQLISTFFPKLTETQLAQFQEFERIFLEWNEKINLISRKDTEHFKERHLLHSLSLLLALPELKTNATVMDLGSGGGFPGLPLAIALPHVQWVLVDSIGKKMRAAQDMAQQLGLENVRCINQRAETLNTRFDFVVTRAVAPLEQLMQWVSKSFKPQHRHGLPNGLFALKGIEQIAQEVKTLPKGSYTEKWLLKNTFKDLEFFETKGIVYAQS